VAIAMISTEPVEIKIYKKFNLVSKHAYSFLNRLELKQNNSNQEPSKEEEKEPIITTISKQQKVNNETTEKEYKPSIRIIQVNIFHLFNLEIRKFLFNYY
jgi:hypothetical protein